MHPAGLPAGEAGQCGWKQRSRDGPLCSAQQQPPGEVPPAGRGDAAGQSGPVPGRGGGDQSEALAEQGLLPGKDSSTLTACSPHLASPFDTLWVAVFGSFKRYSTLQTYPNTLFTMRTEDLLAEIIITIWSCVEIVKQENRTEQHSVLIRRHIQGAGCGPRFDGGSRHLVIREAREGGTTSELLVSKVKESQVKFLKSKMKKNVLGQLQSQHTTPYRPW